MGIGAQKLVPPLLSTSVQPRWSSEMAYVSALWAQNEKITRDTVVREVMWGGVVSRFTFWGAKPRADYQLYKWSEDYSIQYCISED